MSNFLKFDQTKMFQIGILYMHYIYIYIYRERERERERGC